MPARFVLVLPALLAAFAGQAQGPQDPLPPGCDTFTWDVGRELAALRRPAVASVAGTDGNAGDVRIGLDTRYDVRLHPQSEVTLAARPDKPMLEDAATAGVLTFAVPEDGRYRVAITTGHWIDVVDRGRVVPSVDFQGRRGCPLVHKIVEFQLPAGRDLVLQFAGGPAAEAGVTITPVAAGIP